MKKCLVIGGAGFLGINLCEKLVFAGYNVTVYNRDSISTRYMQEKYPEIEYLCADFSQEERFEEILKNIDIVFHLISTTNPANKNMYYDIQSNVLPTIKLLDACIKTNIKKLIFCSSGGAVYGIPEYIPIDEIHRTEPISPYGIHKLTIEKCIEFYGRTYNLNYQILRVSNPYGQWQNPSANQGVIAVFMAKALNNKAIDIWGNGEVVRDYIYIEDVIDACLKVIEYNGNRKIFNIASGKGYSLKEIIESIQMCLDINLDINYLPGRVQDVPQNILDVSLAMKELNWYVKVELKNGLRKMLDMWDAEKQVFCKKDWRK